MRYCGRWPRRRRVTWTPRWWACRARSCAACWSRRAPQPQGPCRVCPPVRTAARCPAHAAPQMRACRLLHVLCSCAALGPGVHAHWRIVLEKQFGADRWRATPSSARPAFLCDVLLEWLAQGSHLTARLRIAGASATTPARGPSHSCCPVLTCCGAAQLKAASAAGAGADLDTVTEELFRQLSAGQTVNLARLLPSPQPAPGAGAPRALPF